MPAQETTCPECGTATTAWVGGLQTPERRAWERACPKHEAKYKKLMEEADQARERDRMRP